MPDSNDLHAFAAAVDHELLDMLGRPPAWSGEGARAARLTPLEREERAARRDRKIAGERLHRQRELADSLEQGSGEVWLRERLSATPWGVPKEVWRARRDRERELLDAEAELHEERYAARERYLADLSLLDPAGPWAQMPPTADATVEEVDELWRAHRRAAEEAARALLERRDVRDMLCPLLSAAGADLHALAREAARALPALDGVPRVPALVAALALLAVREGAVRLCHE
jgi:hypothetical protein